MASDSVFAADVLLVMPPGILEGTKEFFEACQTLTSIDTKAKEASGAFLAAILEHDANQTRFHLSRRQLKDIVAEAKTFNVDKEGMAHAINFTIDSRARYYNELLFCLSVLDKLLAETDTIQSILHTLQRFPNIPPTSSFNQYMARQRVVYVAFTNHYQRCKGVLNSCRKRGSPGEEYGLVPFKDIMYSSDGQVLIWNDILEDWDLPEDIHPCRKMPGSNWGKFFYDMTPGDFFSKEKRPTVEWTHASPAMKLLESLQSTHFLANSATPGPASDSFSQTIRQRNKQIAAATGIPYPIYDTENSQRTTYGSDVGALVNAPFLPPPTDAPRIYELSRNVEEVATGTAPVVKNVQEMEAVVYRLPQ